jgi:molecular chaperone GrpE
VCNSEPSKRDGQSASPASEANSVEVPEEQGSGRPVAAPNVEALLAELEQAKRQVEDYRNDLLRSRAELENLVKRSNKEVANAHKYALERFVSDLLPVKDSLELGRTAADQTPDLAALREGMELTLKMLDATLDRHGVKCIEPLGERFNPELHQAMSVQESRESAPGTVLAVVQKGFLLNDRLIRPAMVIVAKEPQENPTTS